MPSLDEIMKMAEAAQAQLMQAQEDLDKVEVEGASGGGLVKVRATAKGRILGVEIDESLLQPGEKSMVEDLVAAAINDTFIEYGYEQYCRPPFMRVRGHGLGCGALGHGRLRRGRRRWTGSRTGSGRRGTRASPCRSGRSAAWR